MKFIGSLEITELYVIFQTIEISKKFTKLHSEITPTIIKLMKRAVTTGDPINSPIWWVDPLDLKAHKIYDGKIFDSFVAYFLF